MGNKLAGKVAIVTGSGRGIGKAEAMALAAEGAKVVVNDPGVNRDGTGGSRVADEAVAEIKKAGGEAVANYDSVSTAEGGEAIIKTAIDKFGKLDILVNNAGFLRDRVVWNMSEEEFDAVVKVHLYGHFHTMRSACLIFRRQRSGRIINTSSGAGAFGNFGQTNYSGAKEGIVGMTRTVAMEMVKYGVTCNAIRPMAGTRMTLTEDVGANAGGFAEMFQSAKPEMIAPLIVWLSLDDAAKITGRVFDVGNGEIGLYNEPELIGKINEKGKIWTIDELIKLMPEQVVKSIIKKE